MGVANATITQSMTFSALQIGDYTGSVQRVYETAFGIAIGIYSAVTTEWLAGTNVISRASRRSITVEFEAIISNEQAAYTADVRVQTMSAEAFANDIKRANAALSETVPVPLPSSITLAKATTNFLAGDSHRAPASDSDLALFYALVTIALFCGFAAFFVAMCIHCRRKEDVVRLQEIELESADELGVSTGDAEPSLPTMGHSSTKSPRSRQDVVLCIDMPKKNPLPGLLVRDLARAQEVYEMHQASGDDSSATVESEPRDGNSPDESAVEKGESVLKV